MFNEDIYPLKLHFYLNPNYQVKNKVCRVLSLSMSMPFTKFIAKIEPLIAKIINFSAKSSANKGISYRIGPFDDHELSYPELKPYINFLKSLEIIFKDSFNPSNDEITFHDQMELEKFLELIENYESICKHLKLNLV